MSLACVRVFVGLCGNIGVLISSCLLEAEHTYLEITAGNQWWKFVSYCGRQEIRNCSQARSQLLLLPVIWCINLVCTSESSSIKLISKVLMMLIEILGEILSALQCCHSTVIIIIIINSIYVTMWVKSKNKTPRTLQQMRFLSLLNFRLLT